MITSEYPTVLGRSKNKKLLEMIHNTPITETASLKVIFAYLDEYEVKEGIRLTGTSGRGKCEFRGQQVNIMLPREDSGKLTLGITLHEIAHAINYMDHKERDHGVNFVKILDNLAMSEILCRTEVNTKVKGEGDEPKTS